MRPFFDYMSDGLYKKKAEIIYDHFRLSKLTLSYTKASDHAKYCVVMKKNIIFFMIVLVFPVFQGYRLFSYS